MNPVPAPSSGPTSPDEVQAAIVQTVACPACRAEMAFSGAREMTCPQCGKAFAPPPPAGGKQTADLVSASGQKLWTVGTLVYTASGLVLLFFWLLFGDFALSMRDRSVGPLIEKFLLKHGANNTFKQVLTSFLPTAIALVISPIVSYHSDRLRSNWGRRIPYLLVPTPIAGLAMIGIAFSPQMGEWLYLMLGNTVAPGQDIHQAASAYTMTIFTVLWTIFEVAVLTSAAVMGGLINDVVPRPVLGRFFGLFRAISLYDGILFNALLFKHAEQHFTLMFAMIGIIFGGGFTLMCLMVKEGKYPPPPVDDPKEQGPGVGWLAGSARRFGSASMSYLRECFTRPYYLLLFAMITFGALTFRPFNDFTIRYAAQLKMADGDLGNLVAVSYLCSLVIAFPLGMLVDRFHALRLAIVSIALYVVTALWGSLFIKDPMTFGIALVAHTILSGTYFTCTASLGQALFPRSKFSQYASAALIITSLAILLFGPTMGAVLDLTGNKYIYTFWAGLIFATITLALTIVAYWQFNRLGGVKGYLAPGDEAINVTRLLKPAYMWQIIGIYLFGAFVGLALGYVGAYLIMGSSSTSLAEYYKMILADSTVRGVTQLCAATGAIPCGLLGVWAGDVWVKRRAARRA